MLEETRVSNYGYWLLNVAAFVTLLGVAALVLPDLANGRFQQLAFLYFAAFGLLLALYLYTENRPWLGHLYFASQLTLVYLISLLIPEHSLDVQILLFVLSAQSMLFLTMRWGLLWVVTFFLLTLWVGGSNFGWERWPELVPSLGGYLFFASFGAALRQADAGRQRNQQLLEQLQESHEQLKAYTLQAEQLAVSEERNRMAREMHDALGHRLTVAVVQLEGAQRLIPKQPERAAQMVGTMREQLKEALAELRQTLAALRTPLAGEISPVEGQPLVNEMPLKTAVSQLATTFQEATNITVHLDIPDDLPSLPTPHRLAIFRAAQEGLTNIQRHAHASEAWLSVQPSGSMLTLIVADNGQGFGENGRFSPSHQFGLQGLAERAKQLNGRFSWQNREDGGAEIRFWLPLAPQTASVLETDAVSSP